jgi:hypothetical protein
VWVRFVNFVCCVSLRSSLYVFCPLPGTSLSRVRTRHANHGLKCAHQCTTLQATFSQSAPHFPPPSSSRMAQAPAEVDGGIATRSHPPSDDPQLSYAKTPPAPGPASFAQHWLDEDDHNHYGDDEQEYNPDDTECDYYERERSATPTPDPPTAQQQQQQHQHHPSHQTPPPPPPPLLQQQQQRQSQPQIQPQQAQSSSGPSSFAAHVHFHSRVRITSGLRHSRGGGTHALGDSSDSDSPSSSISAPLRFRSRDTTPRAPLTERVSRLATQALQRRRAVAGTRTSSAVSRLLARDCEYAPLIDAGVGVPVTYGAARYGISASNHWANGVRDQSQEEDDSAFGEWPWRALNRHVSDFLLAQRIPAYDR